MSSGDRSTDCVVTWRREWTSCLFSFRTVRPPGITFVPGQFVRLGLVGSDGTMVWRAYSIASAPDAPHLEFYSIVVPGGPFTQPLARVGVGDSVRVDPTVYGFLRTDRFESGRDLWLLATGTGIAPFLSMLADRAIWERFEHVVLVHSVRRAAELAYRDTFADWAASPPFAGARLVYLATLTADDGSAAKASSGRIPALLGNGTLERSAALPISRDDSRFMICGNPSMIREARALLTERGMTPVRRETPGQFITENFW